MAKDDIHRSLTLTVPSKFSHQYSSMVTRITKVPPPPHHQQQLRSKIHQRPRITIHTTIRSSNKILSNDENQMKLNTGLQSFPSYLLIDKHRHESKQHISRSFTSPPNKSSPSLNVYTDPQHHESTPVEEKKQEICTPINHRSSSNVVTENNIDLVSTNSVASISPVGLCRNGSFDIKSIGNYKRFQVKKKRSKNIFCNGYCCCLPSPPCLLLSLVIIVLLIAMTVIIPTVLLTRTNAIATTYITSTTMMTTTPTTSTTTSTTQTTITTTSTSTSTTTPPNCASICNNNMNYNNATTCGLTCVDTGGYMCQSSSTFCAGQSFSHTVSNCNAGNGDSPCSTGYCCVYDTFSSAVPYICLQCTGSG